MHHRDILSATDPDGVVTVRITGDRRIDRVSIAGTASPPTTGSLQRDLAAAYSAALQLLPHRSLRQPGRRPIAAARRPGAAPVFDDPIAAGRTTVDTTGWNRTRPSRAASPGHSANNCLTVTLDPSGSFGRLDTIHGWLDATPARLVGRAITEAFLDAYRKRDAHE